MAESKTLQPALRTLQLICATIVIATDGYAIHVYGGHGSIVHTPTGEFYTWAGVPNAWGFLLFCAAWTILAAIFQLITGDIFVGRAVIGYIRVAIEVVALLSWFAGWIAVAVNIGTEACSERYISCGALKATVIFGAVEWLLFIVTATLTFSHFLDSKHRPRNSTT